MKLMIEPTTEIQEIDGVPCRIWEGTTDKGVPVKAWLRLVQPQTHDEAALADFDRELKALPEPRRSIIITDMRFIT